MSFLHRKVSLMCKSVDDGVMDSCSRIVRLC